MERVSHGYLVWKELVMATLYGKSKSWLPCMERVSHGYLVWKELVMATSYGKS